MMMVIIIMDIGDDDDDDDEDDYDPDKSVIDITVIVAFILIYTLKDAYYL